MMTFFQLFLCAVLGYLLGNIQSGLIIGRLMNNVDLRKHGSGSSGATNALRVLGRQEALFTLLGDYCKGLLAVVAGLVIVGQHGGMVAGLFVVAGHIWPVFFGFQGGKGVATSLGALTILMPFHMIGMAGVGIAIVFLTKTVSVASLSGALVLLISGVITAVIGRDWAQMAFSILMSGLVVYAHRANIDRIFQGKENKLSSSMFKKK